MKFAYRPVGKTSRFILLYNTLATPHHAGQGIPVENLAACEKIHPEKLGQMRPRSRAPSVLEVLP